MLTSGFGVWVRPALGISGMPVKVAHLSRMVPVKEQLAVKKGIADGSVSIVIGTHALLGKAISFADLGLLVVDEEQHFGVKHKEKLKALRAAVHVLTLTATPIPRTLQLALTGLREMSLIATPPVDRLSVLARSRPAWRSGSPGPTFGAWSIPWGVPPCAPGLRSGVIFSR